MNLLQKTDIAELLQVSVRTVDNYLKTQELPFIKVGRNVRFDRESVEKWLQTLEKTRRSSDNTRSSKNSSEPMERNE